MILVVFATMANHFYRKNTPVRKKIQKLLIDAGLTQADIAREIGVAQSTVSLVISRRGRSRRIEEYLARRIGRHPGRLWRA